MDTRLMEKGVYSKGLLISAMLFSTIVMAANFVGQKPLLIFGLIVSSGSVIFPLTYLISILVTEIYGREYAKAIIFTGLLSNILVALFIWQTISFPHPPFWNKQAYYEIFMQQTWWIFSLSSVAYILSEYTNLYVFTFVTKKYQQKYFRFRAFCSTLCAVIIDTLFLIPIMLKSSPTYEIIIHKVFSLVIFKCIFVFSGLLFIAFVRDFIIKRERNLTLLTRYSDLESGEDSVLNPFSNVFWYRPQKRGK